MHVPPPVQLVLPGSRVRERLSYSNIFPSFRWPSPSLPTTLPWPPLWWAAFSIVPLWSRIRPPLLCSPKAERSPRFWSPEWSPHHRRRPNRLHEVLQPDLLNPLRALRVVAQDPSHAPIQRFHRVRLWRKGRRVLCPSGNRKICIG